MTMFTQVCERLENDKADKITFEDSVVQHLSSVIISLQQYFPDMDNRQSNSWVLRPFLTDDNIFKDEDVSAKVEFLGLLKVSVINFLPHNPSRPPSLLSHNSLLYLPIYFPTLSSINPYPFHHISSVQEATNATVALGLRVKYNSCESSSRNSSALDRGVVFGTFGSSIFNPKKYNQYRNTKLSTPEQLSSSLSFPDLNGELISSAA
ncbi:hypothetical protein EVAR_71370_1 [Eumeta japonica]|uniref:Uncharacterized protein n=1 Tax=Eumeta variegata TaxID=151549 RepID=A0A4C2A2G5_EUMVA|nr:hypothetical protein EVAR_71370_1 [Eumeta japonica]